MADPEGGHGGAAPSKIKWPKSCKISPFSTNFGLYAPLTDHPGSAPGNHTHFHILQMQKLLFSATLSQNPEKLTHLNLFQPRLITTLVKQDQQRSKGQQLQIVEGEDEDRGEFVGKYTTPVGLTVSFHVAFVSHENCCLIGFKHVALLLLLNTSHKN